MSDNNKVTIDAAFFCELFRKANETDTICKECREEHTAEEFNAIVKERDGLKAKLDKFLSRTFCGECNDETKACLAAAERCIEDIASVMSVSVIAECAKGMKVNDIIRAYREAKEAK